MHRPSPPPHTHTHPWEKLKGWDNQNVLLNKIELNMVFSNFLEASKIFFFLFKKKVKLQIGSLISCEVRLLMKITGEPCSKKCFANFIFYFYFLLFIDIIIGSCSFVTIKHVFARVVWSIINFIVVVPGNQL